MARCLKYRGFDEIARSPKAGLYLSIFNLNLCDTWFKSLNVKYVVHCKKEKYDLYIGRPSIWGNPFSFSKGTLAKYKVNTRDEAVDSYRAWLLSNPELMKKLPELRGKILGCWCAPQRCHGDVLAELSNTSNGNEK